MRLGSRFWPLAGLLAALLASAGEPVHDVRPAALRPVAQTAAPAAKQVISRIELSGLKQIDEAVVRDALGLKLGEPFDPEKLQKGVDNLYELGWFFFARDEAAKGSVITKRLDADGNVEVHLVLIENPTVAAIKLLGAPRPVAPDKLADKVAWIKVGRPLNTNVDRLSRALRDVEALYRELYQVEISAALPRPDDQPSWRERTPDGQVIVNIKVAVKGAAAPPRPLPADAPA